MQIRYDSEAAVLLLVLRDSPPVDTVEEPGGVIISYGEDGEPVSVEFLCASARHLIRAGEISVTHQAESVRQQQAFRGVDELRLISESIPFKSARG